MARKNAQIVNTTTEITTLSKDCNWMDSLHNEAFRFYPGKEEWRKRLIASMYHWLETEQGLVFEEFLFAYKIPSRTFYFWVKTHEDIADAYKELKQFIAMRRKRGCITFDYHVGAAYKDMHLYDPEWGEKVDKYHADLKKVENENMGNVTVLMEPIGEKK